MKLIANIYTKEQFNNLASYVDGVIVYVNKLSLIPSSITIDEAYDMSKALKKDLIIGMNKILHEGDLAGIMTIFEEYKDKNVLFYVTDLGAANIAIKLGLIDRVIYDPVTMITNTLDFNEYLSLGFNSVSISQEIPLNDVATIINSNPNKGIYKIFGLHQMMNSKRKVLSLYTNKAGIKLSNTKHYLKEEKRDDLLPIIENENGTFIYRSYYLSYLDNFEELKNLKYGLIETLLLDNDEKVLSIIKDVYEGRMDINKANDKLSKLNISIESGFKYQDSVYQKEEF